MGELHLVVADGQQASVGQLGDDSAATIDSLELAERDSLAHERVGLTAGEAQHQGTRDPSLAALLTALTIPAPNTRMGRGVTRGIRPGRAIGRLVGGNLSLVQQSIGTPYEVPVDDAILFLEETKDPMSVVDERLLHLRASGLLPRVRGIVFGQLSLDRSEEDEFEDFVLDLVSDLDVPVLMDFPAGHELPNLTLPLGTEVELVVEEESGWILYHEDALTLLSDS